MELTASSYWDGLMMMMMKITFMRCSAVKLVTAHGWCGVGARK